MEDNMEKKKDIIIIVLCILILILASILVTKIVVKNQTVVLNEKYNVLNLEKCVNKACNKSFEFNDNELTVKKNGDSSYEITYNDYVIFASADKPYIGDAIYTYEDSLLFPVKDENGNIRLMQYQMGNFSSEEIHFGEDDFWYVKKVDSKENEMTVEVSRFFQKNTFVDMPNEAFVEIDACNLYQEFQDRDASMTYVIRYQDGKFSEPKLKSTKKLNEFSDYSSLCNKK